MRSLVRKDKHTRMVSRTQESPEIAWPRGKELQLVSRDAMAVSCSEWDPARSQHILQICVGKSTDGIVISEMSERQHSSASRVNAVRSSSAAVGLGHHFILFQFLIIPGFSTPTCYCSG